MFKAAWSSFNTTLQNQRDRWILWSPVPLALGIGCYFSLNVEPPLLVSLLLLPTALLCALPFRKNKDALLIWLVFFLFAVGFSAAQFKTWRVEAPILHGKATRPLTLQGRIVGVESLEKSYRVTLENISVQESSPQTPMLERVRVKLKSNDTAIPVAGDVVEIKSILRPLPSPVLPGAYDFQKFSYFNKLGATGYALSNIKVIKPHEADFFFESLRRAIREKVAQNILDKDTAALAIAFLIGDSQAISKHDWNVARQSGIAHLIAISGSHFALIVGVVFFMTRAALAAFPYAALRWPIKKISASVALFIAVFYMLLIGSPIPAQRACVMACGLLLAIILDRDPFTLRIAALAAFVVLLMKPESLTGASFQMSFAAVIGLIAFFESTRDWWSRQYMEAGAFKKSGLFLLSCLLTTVAATAATAPFSLFHFLRVSFVGGLIANMIAVPLSSFITFPAGLLACLMMPLGLEKFPILVMEESIKIIMRIAEIVASWPDMAIEVDAWPTAWLGVATMGGLWLCIWQGRMRWLGLLPIIAVAVAIPMQPRPDILIGGHFKLLAAVRDENGKLWLSPGKADAFIRKAWIEREGQKGSATWLDEGVGNFLSCDKRACIYRAKGQIVVFNKQSDFRPAPDKILDIQAAERDCESADIVVMPSAKKPRGCAGKKAVVIDKWAIRDKGVHVIYLNARAPPKIVSVSDWRGDRPWTRWKK